MPTSDYYSRNKEHIKKVVTERRNKIKELYVGEMPGTKDHIIGICPKCTDLVKKVEKNTDINIDNNSPATK